MLSESWAGSRLARYGDMLGEKTGLGRTWIGQKLVPFAAEEIGGIDQANKEDGSSYDKRPLVAYQIEDQPADVYEAAKGAGRETGARRRLRALSGSC